MAYDRILRRFQALTRSGDYVITAHGEEKMIADGYTIFDIERGVLSGHIVERQRDEQTGESKYRIRGVTDSWEQIEVVATFGVGGNMVIITVYSP